jgi:thioredoxin-like negative regulator of GroEL
MEHKIKSQIAFFYSERSGEYKEALKDLEATAEKFAGQIIMLYLDIDDPSNKPVR